MCISSPQLLQLTLYQSDTTSLSQAHVGCSTRPLQGRARLTLIWFLAQMYARFSPQQVVHAGRRGCRCARGRYSAGKSSVAQSTAALRGPALGGGPTRRQPARPQGAEALALTGRRTMKARGTRPRLSTTFDRWAELLPTVQPLWNRQGPSPFRCLLWPDFQGACNSSPDTDGVLQARKSLIMRGLLAMKTGQSYTDL